MRPMVAGVGVLVSSRTSRTREGSGCDNAARRSTPPLADSLVCVKPSRLTLRSVPCGQLSPSSPRSAVGQPSTPSGCEGGQLGSRRQWGYQRGTDGLDVGGVRPTLCVPRLALTRLIRLRLPVARPRRRHPLHAPQDRRTEGDRPARRSKTLGRRRPTDLTECQAGSRGAIRAGGFTRSDRLRSLGKRWHRDRGRHMSPTYGEPRLSIKDTAQTGPGPGRHRGGTLR